MTGRRPAPLRWAISALLAASAVGCNPLVGGGSAVEADFNPGFSALAFSPASVAFEGTRRCRSSAAQRVTVTNRSAEAVSRLSIALARGVDFVVSGSSCGTTAAPIRLAPGESCALQLTFSPSSSGTKTDSLAAVYDDALQAGKGRILSLSATGLTPISDLSLPANRVYPLDGASPPLTQSAASANALASTATNACGNPIAYSCTYRTPGLSTSDSAYAAVGTNCALLPSLVTTAGVVQPGNSTFSSSSGTLTWWPTSTQRGTHQFTLTAADAVNGESNSGTYFITVREAFAAPATLALALDAQFGGSVPGLSASAAATRVSAGAANSVAANWPGLLGSLGGLTAGGLFGTAAPWAGLGSASSPYALTFSGASDRMSLGSVIGSNSQLMFSAWLSPANSAAAGTVVLGNGGGSANGFVLRQSAESAGKLELAVGSYSQPYSTLVMASTPVAYWRLNETVGTTATDASGSGFTGTYTGGYTLSQAGALASGADGATSFNGTTGYVNLGTPNLGLTTALTLSFWIKPTTQGTVLYQGWNFVAAEYGWIVHIGSNNNCHTSPWTLSFGSGDNVANANCGSLLTTGPNAITPGVWQHVGIIKSGTQASIYINGALVASKTMASSTIAFAAGQALRASSAVAGDATYYNTSYGGVLDELAIYNTALTPAQLTSHYFNGRGIQCQTRSTLANGAWNFVAGIWDGSLLSLLVNGQPECQTSLSGVTFTSPASATTYVGASPANSAAWAGAVADLKIHVASAGGAGTVAAAQAEFDATANRFRATPLPDLVTSGLVASWDAANANQGLRAYDAGCATSDLTWTDLSPSRMISTLSGFLPADCSGATANGWQANPARLEFNAAKSNYTTSTVGYPSTLADSYTFEAWVKLPTIPATTMYIMDVGDANVFAQGLYAATTGRFGACAAYPSSYDCVSGTSVLVPEAWYHVVVVRDAVSASKKLYLYVNAASDVTPVTLTGTSALYGTLKSVNLGSRTNGTSPFTGGIAKISIYNRPLALPEIQQNCRVFRSRLPGAICN